MPNGKTTHPPQTAALTATRNYDLDQERREEESFNRLLRSLIITKWIAIIWVSIYFILACVFFYALFSAYFQW